MQINKLFSTLLEKVKNYILALKCDSDFVTKQINYPFPTYDYFTVANTAFKALRYLQFLYTVPLHTEAGSDSKEF